MSQGEKSCLSPSVRFLELLLASATALGNTQGGYLWRKPWWHQQPLPFSPPVTRSLPTTWSSFPSGDVHLATRRRRVGKRR